MQTIPEDDPVPRNGPITVQFLGAGSVSPTSYGTRQGGGSGSQSRFGVKSHQEWAAGPAKAMQGFVPTCVAIGLSKAVCTPLPSVMGFGGERSLLLYGRLNRSLFGCNFSWARDGPIVAWKTWRAGHTKAALGHGPVSTPSGYI